jgi:hypothetical protein
MSARPVLHPDDNPLFGLLAHCENMFGIDMLDDQVQIVASAQIADAAAHAPFESGLLTISPARSVLVVLSATSVAFPAGRSGIILTARLSRASLSGISGHTRKCRC